MTEKVILDLTPDATAELNKLKGITGESTEVLFRHAFSLLRIYVKTMHDGNEMTLNRDGGIVEFKVVLPLKITKTGEI